MTSRMIAILTDAVAGREIDLVRALYDRAHVDVTPPHVPVINPFEENTPLADLVEMVGLIVSVHQPFVMQLGTPERAYDHDPDAEHPQLLQLLASQGADESQRLAEALYRDVFPHQRPDFVEDTPLRRTAMTIGRFKNESEAERAATALADKSYFLVVSQVGLLEEEDDGWAVRHTMDLGGMVMA